MKSRILVTILCLIMACSSLTGCNRDHNSAITNNAGGTENDTNISDTELSTDDAGETLHLMVAKLPAWAEKHNETASEKLTIHDITVKLENKQFESTLASAEPQTGNYTYEYMTGEYHLSETASVREATRGYKYITESEEISLIPYEENHSQAATLIGETNVVTNGFTLTINFTLNLYDNGTYLLEQAVSPATMEGTWIKKPDGSISLNGEGITVTSSTYDTSTSTATIHLDGSLSGISFQLTLTGSI